MDRPRSPVQRRVSWRWERDVPGLRHVRWLTRALGWRHCRNRHVELDVAKARGGHVDGGRSRADRPAIRFHRNAHAGASAGDAVRHGIRHRAAVHSIQHVQRHRWPRPDAWQVEAIPRTARQSHRPDEHRTKQPARPHPFPPWRLGASGTRRSIRGNRPVVCRARRETVHDPEQLERNVTLLRHERTGPARLPVQDGACDPPKSSLQWRYQSLWKTFRGSKARFAARNSRNLGWPARTCSAVAQR